MATPRLSARPYNATALPCELLLDVFARDKDPPVLMTLALVCHQWKDVVYNQRSLWTQVAIQPSTTLRQLRAQLTRSGDLELDVEIIFVPWDLSEESRQVLSVAMDQYERIRCLNVDSLRLHDEDVDDMFGFLDWPEDATEHLSDFSYWPCLRTLELVADKFDVGDFSLYIVAPDLSELYLAGVPAMGWYGAFFALAADVRTLKLKNQIDLVGFFQSLRLFPSLQHLSLDDEDGARVLFSQELPGFRPFVLVNLVSFHFNWLDADVGMFLKFLACCPALVDLSASAVFKQHGQVDVPQSLQLRLLTKFFLRMGGRNTESNLLELLLPALQTARLQHITLWSATLEPTDISSLITPNLLSLELGNLRCDMLALLQAIQRCHRLVDLWLHNLYNTSTNILAPEDTVTLLALRKASFDVSPPDSPTLPLGASRGVALFPAFWALMPLPDITSVTIEGIDLSMDYLMPMLREVGSRSDDLLSLEVELVEDYAFFTLCSATAAGARDYDSDIIRKFETNAFLESLALMNHESTNIFSRLASLTVAIGGAAVLFLCFALLSNRSAGGLASLRCVTIWIPANVTNEAVVASLDATVRACTSRPIRCQHLNRVFFEHTKYGPDMVIPKQLADAFVACFKSDIQHVSIESGCVDLIA
ncbi:hypothetical protein EXIGLDRAFT_837049 [Exidia glandulosa HHB12029]|uniref:F-box domain-containing protein n=1 Tax=Exidia glandulosa HHB12029 TaxID=1314781 RepID=A0A165H5B2_EXIGL|nr:hypothetical protein EXIGLDRAFT_837049 [Exidia glandulosa HHB12029]